MAKDDQNSSIYWSEEEGNFFNAKFREIAKRPKNRLTSFDVVNRNFDSIHQAISSGYSYDEMSAELLAPTGRQFSAASLKRYYTKIKKQRQQDGTLEPDEKSSKGSARSTSKPKADQSPAEQPLVEQPPAEPVVEQEPVKTELTLSQKLALLALEDD
jgi:hypothetical protein